MPTRLIRDGARALRLRGVDGDGGDADHEAPLEGVDLERLVEQVGGLGLELDLRALQYGGAVVLGLQRVERAPVEEEQRGARKRSAGALAAVMCLIGRTDAGAST